MSIDTFLLSADTTDLDYPEVRPTLDLNFARVKALDPRITFTRASGGSYVGADGLIKLAGVNEARFDHDPVTGESLGLLIEESRTNLLERSEEFDDSSWTKASSSVTSNDAKSPDGTLNADKIVSILPNITLSQRIFGIFEAGSTYIFSVYLKADESNIGNSVRIGLRRGDGALQQAYTEVILTEKWQRTTITITWSVARTEIRSDIRTDFTSGTPASSFYAWGAQVEAGSFPTSYIPTQASTRTRAADNASITGKNFSEWYRQDEGTIFLSYYIIGSNSDNTVMAINNTTQNEQIDSRWFASGTGYRVRVGGVNQASYAMGDIPPLVNINYKTSFGYQKNNFSMSLNNTTINDSTGDIPNLVQMEIGKRVNSSRGNIQLSRLSYYPKRLPNQQLQVLTR
jgi:hypothetical protein